MFNKDKIFIMGDMGELGDKAVDIILDIFRFAKDSSKKYLFTWVITNLKLSQYLKKTLYL